MPLPSRLEGFSDAQRKAIERLASDQRRVLESLTPEQRRAVAALAVEPQPMAVMVARCVRRESAYRAFGLPLYMIATGPDLAKGEMRGHAKAIFAVGDIASGVVAIGGWARGVIAVGGAAFGEHVVSATRRDADAVELFSRYGIEVPATRRR